jgi:hypothetical protein
MTAAIKLRGQPNGQRFIAESCEVRDGFVHATGRTRRMTGPEWSRAVFYDRRTVSWPESAVEEIRWAYTAVMAA